MVSGKSSIINYLRLMKLSCNGININLRVNNDGPVIAKLDRSIWIENIKKFKKKWVSK